LVPGRVTGRWVKVRAGQAGRTIVDEARKSRVQAIAMPLRNGLGPAGFRKTIQVVLRDRPCRVILARDRQLERTGIEVPTAATSHA